MRKTARTVRPLTNFDLQCQFASIAVQNRRQAFEGESVEVHVVHRYAAYLAVVEVLQRLGYAMTGCQYDWQDGWIRMEFSREQAPNVALRYQLAPRETMPRLAAYYRCHRCTEGHYRAWHPGRVASYVDSPIGEVAQELLRTSRVQSQGEQACNSSGHEAVLVPLLWSM